MSRVKDRDTRPEMRLRRALYAVGLRYRLQAKELPGRPDIVFRQVKLAIFVHGCFWHRHAGCEHSRTPKSRLDFWLPKFARNVERDAHQRFELEAQGWTVLILWECEIHDDSHLAAAVAQIRKLVKNTPLSAHCPSSPSPAASSCG